MPLQITIGSPQLVIHQAETVWAADPDGQLGGDTDRGLMFRDTRLISMYLLLANGQRWELLNGAATSHYSARVFMTNAEFLTRDGPVPARTVSLVLGRWIDGGAHEDIDITNHGTTPIHFNLELLLRADFGDVFEVKSGKLVRRGQISTVWDEAAQCLANSYRNEDFHRSVVLRAKSAQPAMYANGRLTFDVSVPPGGTWHACLLYDIADGAEVLAAPAECGADSPDSAAAKMLADWRRMATKLQSSNEEFYRLYHQALDDLAALRLPIKHDDLTHIVPAAGLPWFVALFGRDSLIVAMQTSILGAEFARGSLVILGAQQSLVRDDYRDAEPGKILHEMRLGELAHFKLIPHTPYFGTADATPLYLMVLHEAWRWTGDRALIERILPIAERCLTWIDEYGDRDGDGFQEYQTRSSLGYENMAWKDAGDAVLYPDGTLVKGPKALCELQGYVYAAWQGMAEIFDALGQPDRAVALRGKAAKLAEAFDRAYWNEEFGGYAYALDGDKKQVLSMVSNIGHCLWTGLIPKDKAARVVQRLMQPDMFSGWGIRTLSADHIAFNPHSYHNGSVWPHDNGILAQGMARYGFHAEAAKVARAVSGAASHFAMHQVPELYAGIARNGASFPVQFLGSNVPQAWAAGSAFSFLQAIVGLQPDAAAKKLYVDAQLPAWLPNLELSDIDVGGETFTIRFEHHEGGTTYDVLSGPHDWVEHRARS